jgi:glycine cleavage system T protein (aminomethyltransferase)
MQQQLPLASLHRDYGGEFVDFAGWSMPLHYGTQLEEHRAVREGAGVFDVSHMTIVDLLGAGGRNFLRHLLANDVDKISQGKALYSCMLNDRGGIIDDLIVYMRSVDSYRLVLNAATREADLAWLQQQAQDVAVGLQEQNNFVMLAVQGPQAIDKTKAILPAAQQQALMALAPFECADIDDMFVARTGYTGEDGFEIMLPADKAHSFWQSLVDNGVKPCGLGARDILRLEAGLLLYGQDMDTNTTPLESALAWTVSLEPADRDFVGRAALELQKQNGVKNKLVGLVLEDKGVMRHGQTVQLADERKGVITSGTFSPVLGRSVALARIPRTEDKQCHVMVRDKALSARIVAPRFVKHGKSLLD